MNGRKREEEREKREESGERNSERSELRPPDTSTLPPPLTLPTLITQTSLNIIQNTTFHNILCNTLNTICPTLFSTLTRNYITILFPTFTTIHTTNTIATNSFSLRLFNSFITDFSLENEHTTDFTSVLGKTLNTNSTDSCNCSNLAYFIDGIVVTCLVINHRTEHLQESVTRLTSARLVEHLIEVRCSL